MDDNYNISVLIPCYKSERTIEGVIVEVIDALKSMSIRDYEIIAIDDCSPDGVFNKLKRIGETNTRVKVIRFSKNFGQHAGMIAGVQHSCGDICVFLDDDGQCPIENLDRLIEPLCNGYDVAIAGYGKKKQSLFKNLGSRFNEVVANALIDKPKEIQMGNFIAFRRFVAEEISRYKGPYPYISGLLFRSTTRIISVPMEERERRIGNTTYTLKKLVSLWIDSFTAFSVKPLRFAIIVGTGSAIVGIILVMIVVIRKLLNPAVQTGWSSIIAILLVLGGMILFVLGIIGEYIGRIYMSVNETPQYVISETYNM